MRVSLFLFFFMLILCASVSAQTVKIKKIIDSNLFETADGRIIKLAGLDVPNKNHPDRYLRGVADKALVYARSVFLNRFFDVNPLAAQDSTKGYELVIVQKNYPLGLLDYNKEYLSQGFGRFTGKVPRTFYNEYRDAEQDALANERGIWKVVAGGSADVLDRQFSAEEINGYIQKDSLISLRHPREMKRSLAGILVGELFLGPAAGVVIAIPATYLFAGISSMDKKSDRWSDITWMFIGMGVGYIAGTGIGVYAVAYNDNPNVSFLGTLTASFVGAAAGIGIASLMNSSKSSAPYIVVLAGPLIGSMIYTNFLVPRPVYRDYYPYAENPVRAANLYSHKDLYNSTLQFNMNLFTLAF